MSIVKLKENIDDIAMDVINETNKYESIYWNNLQGETLRAFVI
jgi:hypothetical protein